MTTKRVFTLLAAACLSVAYAFAQSATPQTPAEALAEAARKGDAAMVKKLVDTGVDVNTKFRYGATALSYAADHGHLEVVKVLLAAGADVNVKDTFYGMTPLSWASGPATKRTPAHAEIVGLLLQKGATGKAGALMAAASEGDAAMTNVILDSGGLTPAQLSNALEAATNAKHADAVAALERAGAKPHPIVTLTAEQLARFPGTYVNAAGVEVVIAVAGERLTIRPATAAPTATTPLTARSETTFAGPGLNITFRIENGTVVGFDRELDSGPMRFTRKPGT